MDVGDTAPRIAMTDGSDAHHIAPCAVLSTVAATVASAAYAVPMRRLAASSRAAGFPCLVVQPFDNFSALQGRHIRSLSVPNPPLLPRREWCGHPRYGWRRSHMHRSRMWRVVIEAGFHLLAIDVDWSFTDVNGHPLQPSMDKVVAALRSTRTETGHFADVVAGETDYRQGGSVFNVGLMWLRSTPTTLALVRRCEARSHSGWEQGVFNEEIGWGDGTVHCCVPDRWSSCNMAAGSWGNAHAVARRLPRVHDAAHEEQHERWRVGVEGPDVCAAYPPSGVPQPPRNSPPGLWAASQYRSGAMQANLAALGWHADQDNLLVKGAASLAWGRCQRAARLNRCKCPEVAEDDHGLRGADMVRLEKLRAANASWSSRRVAGDAFVLPLLRHRLGAEHVHNGSVTIGDWVRFSAKEAWNPFVERQIARARIEPIISRSTL